MKRTIIFFFLLSGCFILAMGCAPQQASPEVNEENTVSEEPIQEATPEPEVEEPEVEEPEVETEAYVNVEAEVEVAEVEVEVAEEQDESLENILFDFDKSLIRVYYKKLLDDFSGRVSDKSSVEIVISGHADERGSNEYNLALGERRALAVKEYLIILGFSSENIRTRTFGEEFPIAFGKDKSSWNLNRRAETLVLYYSIN